MICENFGSRMCIDDKNFGDRGFTILSNLETGKIAFMIETRKSKIINEVLSSHVSREILDSVKILTKDLAYNYEEVRKGSFWSAIGVADKFHVIKLVLQALSDLRVKYRQEELTKQRERRELHKSNEARNRESARKNNQYYQTKKCPPSQKMRNRETILQILTSTNKALNQFQGKWGKEMKERIEILFEKFPDLKRMYKMISVFRGIYDVNKTNRGFNNLSLEKAKISLEKWFRGVGASGISELQNFASTVAHHKNSILAYFDTGETNAYAESLNSKLQRFFRENFGIKNLEFFLYRIKTIFA